MINGFIILKCLKLPYAYLYEIKGFYSLLPIILWDGYRKDLKLEKKEIKKETNTYLLTVKQIVIRCSETKKYKYIKQN